MKFVFISGSHKSGTSWLAKMVGAHPKIGIPDQELWLFGNQRSLAEYIIQGVSEWLTLPTVSTMYHNDNLKKKVRNSIIRASIRGAISTSVGDLSNLSIIGDKTPNFYALSANMLHEVFPDAFFIHIVRDPRDVIVSHHFHAYRLKEWDFFGDRERACKVGERILDGEDVTTDLLDLHAVSRLSSHWRQVQEGSQNAAALFGKRYYQISYEYLLLNASEILSDIFVHLGEEVDESVTSSIVDNNNFKNLSGGREAGNTDPLSFFRKGVAGDWMQYFNEDSLNIVKSECSEIANYFSYDLE